MAISGTILKDKMKDEILGKYHFPILRFGTNERNEKVKLVGMLEELLQGNIC